MKLFLLIFSVFFSTICLAGNTKITLAGEWMFRLDPHDEGVSQKWFAEPNVYTDYIILPGALQNQGYGNNVTVQTNWITNENQRGLWYTHPMYETFRKKDSLRYINNFQPQKHYVGVAWYKKVIDLDWEQMRDKEVLLFLERVHWESTLWINGQKVDSYNSLLAPHVYDISQYLLKKGKLSVVLRVDNRPVIDMGKNAHSWGDQTMTAWNGIVGDMHIKVEDCVHVSDIQIYPDLKTKTALLKYVIKNNTTQRKKIFLSNTINSYNTKTKHDIPVSGRYINLTPGENKLDFSIALTDSVLLWDEYHPNLYRMTTSLAENGNLLSRHKETFGVREISTRNNRFVLNGREVYLRGNVLCGSFPMTGYASMDYDAWKRIMTIHKYYGLNHIRFHSWTPPEAAFKAADEVGIYLFAETDAWVSIKSREQAQFLLQEGRNNLQFYGNHPSFLFMGLGNELSARKEITDKLLCEFKKDNRRLYTGLSNSTNSITALYDFIVTREVRSTIGWPPSPERSFFYRNIPSTDFEFGNPIKYSVPLITHEAGQHCSYPALDQMQKFTGTQFAGYIDVARNQLKERGMLHLWPDFVKASGKLQTMMYKHELEAYLRMPRHTGYEILQLEDFPGQGSALVGILDYFYDNKGYVTPDEFRKSCAPMTLMLKLPKFTWMQGETLTAEAYFSNWGERNLKDALVIYHITDSKGKSLLMKKFTPQSIVRGDAVSLGSLSLNLTTIDCPTKLKISAYMQGTDLVNEWFVWVYPNSTLVNDDITIVSEFNETTVKRIIQGEDIVIQLDKSKIRGGMPPVFFPVYWTQFDKMGISQTMGILCNPNHPVFNSFPTEYHTNWQWFELLRDSYPLIFDEFGMKNSWEKSFLPTIQVIDGWKTNRKLGVLAEAKMGKGRFIVTSINLTDSLEHRIVARQFRNSLGKYMKSSDFAPEATVNPSQVYALISESKVDETNSLIANILFENLSSSSNTKFLVDNSENTIWQGYIESKKGVGSIILNLSKEVRIGNIIIGWLNNNMNLSYNIYLTKDKNNWGIPIAGGKVPKTKLLDVDLQYFHEAEYVKIEFISSQRKDLHITGIKLTTD